ncbi:MAG: class I SAM-dependent methyltransferase [bacterium]
MSSYSDYFSSTAVGYASFRPTYPAELFAWIATQAARHSRAWDTGTGSGQAAILLARHFDEVVATDPSFAQLVNAKPAERVYYAAMTAESSALPNASVDLVTVAQALHWFDLDRFYREVERVLTPDGVVAVWTYGLLTIDPEIDARISRFYKEEVGKYWPAERALVDAGYSGIAFPFREIETPSFAMRATWTLDQLSGYLETWSAVTRYTKANGRSPVKEFISGMRPLWGEASRERLVCWSLELRMGRI